MNTLELSNYLTGIMQMASSLSNNIGPSYINVECYEKEKFAEEFCREYKITDQDLDIEIANRNLITALFSWFGNEKQIVDSIVYWFNLKCKEKKTIYLPSEKLMNKISKKENFFYYLEDVLFIESEKNYIVLYLGNNE